MPGRFFKVMRETWLSRTPNAWAALIGGFATLLLAIGSLISWSDLFNAADFMAASRKNVFIDREYWRLWTSLFVHGDEKHLLSNAFLFFILGSFMHGYFGLRAFPLAAFFFGGLVNALTLMTMPADVHLIGASGVVFWLGGAWLVLYAMIERGKSVMQRLLRIGGVALLLFMPAEAFDPKVSYKAHFIGFGLGIVWALVYFWLNRTRFRSAEVVELIHDEDDD